MRTTIALIIFVSISSSKAKSSDDIAVEAVMERLSAPTTSNNFFSQLMPCTAADSYLEKHPAMQRQCKTVTAPAIYRIAKEMELEKTGHGCRPMLTSLMIMKKNEKWAYERCSSGIMKNIGDCKDISGFTTFYDPEQKIVR